MKIIYVACPYTHTDDKTVESRVRIATKYAAHLMNAGHIVFSPLTHSHPVSDYLSKERKFDHDFWMNQDLQFLAGCTEMHVLCLPGMENSRGVQAEIKFANDAGMPIEYINPGRNWSVANSDNGWESAV